MATRIDREQVVGTALRVLNDVGLEGLTLRRIAGELGVQAPALYWHVKSKQDLLDEMATELLRRAAIDFAAGREGCGEVREGGGSGTARDSSGPADATWQETLSEAMRSTRRVLLRHRDGGKVFGGTRFQGTEYAAHLNRQFAALTEAGFALAAAARAVMTAYAYTIGYVVEEQSTRGDLSTGEGAYDVDERAERLRGHPLAAAAGYEMFAEYDEGFEAGLAAIVAGVEVTLLRGD
ncbi:TetR/AcrR family transcriptional regulator C-terminal domain-containing protein [Streptomyces sp. NPDC050610]|uniref:TetR/AcrR family transcriptional regulator C-terminal domain-containing protein n=1 Tax=Streptomyces sp. NPDC050610 TaxID=3157097 RepID=UPI003446F707